MVPTRVLAPISSLSVVWVWVTANPKSAMQHVPLLLTNMFLVLMSLWAIAGFPCSLWTYYYFFYIF